MSEAKDRYDEMTGPVLAEELGRRELAVTGRVDELRARLREDDAKRAEKAAEAPDEGDGGEETDTDDIDVPEPRQPIGYDPMSVVLNEDQARTLNGAEARLRRHFRHVTPVAERKYCAGDRVTGIGDFENNVCRVLPLGIEIELERDDQDEDGLEKLSQADAELGRNEG